MSLTDQRVHTFDIEVKVNGVPLLANAKENLVSAVVDDGVQQADVVELRFRDQDRMLLTPIAFPLGGTLVVSMLENSMPKQLIEAEITSVEAEYDLEVGSLAVVRGFDRSHKMFRNRSNKNWLMMKASDIVSMLAAQNGLLPSVDATTTVFQHISQANESDWEFCSRLARHSGYVLSVTGRKLSFKRPETPTLGLPITLEAGKDLLRARIGLTSNEQVGTVVARSYDPILQQPVEGRMAVATTVSRPGMPLPIVHGTARVSQEYLSTDKPLAGPGDAQARAMALAKQIAEGYVELHGETFGNPALKAGSTVTIKGMGPSFNGTFRVTSTRHVYSGDALYTTEFDVTGATDDSLLGLAGGGGAGGGGGGRSDRIDGVMVGVVSDNNDPQQMGRVKVRIPALGATFATNWAQVVYPGAGGTRQPRGMQLVPEVSDHVLVAFELGDIDRPFVLGGLYTSMQKPPRPTAVQGGKVTQRTLVAQNGDFIEMGTAAEGESITISAFDKKVFVKLGTGRNMQKHTLEITTDLDVVVNAGQDVKVKATRDVNVEATGKVNVKATGPATLESTAALTLKGATVKIEASGPVEVKGTPIKLN